MNPRETKVTPSGIILTNPPKFPELHEIKKEIDKLLPNNDRVAGYIAANCLQLLKVQQDHLEAEILKAVKTKEDSLRVECNKIRLQLVKEICEQISGTDLSQRGDIEEITRYLLGRLQNLYDLNNEITKRYWSHNKLISPHDFGKLGIDLHLYIKEFAKHGSYQDVLARQVSNDFWHPEAPAPQQNQSKGYRGLFNRTPAELEAASKMPDLAKVHEEGSKLEDKELSAYIVGNCQRLLIENKTRLLGLIGNEENKFETLEQKHACEIRKIRLSLVQEALSEIKNIVFGETFNRNKDEYFALIANHTLLRLHKLYVDNCSITELYNRRDAARDHCEMGLGKLATDLHFYITEFAKLSGDMGVLQLQQAQDHNHIRANSPSSQQPK